VSERLGDFGDQTDVVVVAFSDPANVGQYASRHDLAIPILTDPTRNTYRAFGLGRGSVLRVWGWKATRRYVELFRTDGLAGLRRPTEDTLQLGGDFVIDAHGNLSYGFWGDGPDDRPAVDELLDAARRSTT